MANNKKNTTTSKKDEKTPNRSLKKKNYIVLIGIYIVTFLLILLVRNWYISYRDYQLTIPVLKGDLNEVTVAELDHYVTAHPEAIIYIEVSEEENSREVAKDLIDVVKERDLVDRVVYLNLSSVEDKEKFFKEFSDKYIEDKELKYYPALVLFIDGKVESFVSRKENQKLNIGDIAQLFDQYELEG